MWVLEREGERERGGGRDERRESSAVHLPRKALKAKPGRFKSCSKWFGSKTGLHVSKALKLSLQSMLKWEYANLVIGQQYKV